MEVYDGLSKGVIDGVNRPFETLKTFRFAEVAKYTTSSWSVGNLYTFYVIMNKNSYEKLPPDLKEILSLLGISLTNLQLNLLTRSDTEYFVSIFWNLWNIGSGHETKIAGLGALTSL